MHLRDDSPGIVWPGYWSLLGGSCDPGESPAQAITRELQEEAGLDVEGLTECFSIFDAEGSRQWDTFFLGHWDGDETALYLREGIKLQFFTPDELASIAVPPYIFDGIHRVLALSHCLP
jgi:8-oxo-dGTP diphosphatase